MEKKKAVEILDKTLGGFARVSQAFMGDSYRPPTTQELFSNQKIQKQEPSKAPVYVYQKKDDDKWRVSFLKIQLGIFEVQSDAIEFATIVARTNDVDINIYRNGRTEEIIKVNDNKETNH